MQAKRPTGYKLFLLGLVSSLMKEQMTCLSVIFCFIWKSRQVLGASLPTQACRYWKIRHPHANPPTPAPNVPWLICPEKFEFRDISTFVLNDYILERRARFSDSTVHVLLLSTDQKLRARKQPWCNSPQSEGTGWSSSTQRNSARIWTYSLTTLPGQQGGVGVQNLVPFSVLLDSRGNLPADFYQVIYCVERKLDITSFQAN